MRASTTLLCAAAAAALALAYPVDARRGGGGGGGGHGMGGGGGGGRPVASYPGAKPSTGGGHWAGGRHWGGGGGQWSGGRHHGHGGHRHHGHGHHHHGHGHFYGYWPAWSVGIGVGWPYWGWGWGSPYWGGYYPYRGYYYTAPADGPVYVNPDPLPAYGTQPYRWYCPASAAYYPDVRDCARPWLKVMPTDGSGPPPAQDDAPATPAEPAPESPPAPPTTSPSYYDPAPKAATGRVRIAAPRLTSPTEIASRRAMQDALALGELR